MQSEPSRLAAYSLSFYCDKEEDERALKAPEIVAIFENNCFKICNSQNTADVWAVFFKAGNLNHSCIPNSHASWDRTTGTLELCALSKISKDEELTITYENCFFDLYVARQAKLKDKYGFDCDCEACDMTTTLWLETETKRKRIADIEELFEKQKTVKNLPREQHESLYLEMLNLMAGEARGTFLSAKA